MSRNRKNCLRAAVAWVVFLPLAASWAAGNPGGTYADWLRYRDGAVGDPRVLRFYTFDELWNDNTAVPSLASEEAPLKYSFVRIEGQPDEHVTLVEGRWPDKRAIRLDRGVLSGQPLAPGEKGFTIAAWLRTHGKGSLSDQPVPTGGTLLSQGSGYYSGCRLTILYPQGRLAFEMGRPQGSFMVTAANMPDGVWHHVAATWDRREIRVYLDGLLVGRGEYTGEYTAPEPAVFRIGYADSGWGSAILDVDEVVGYAQALSAAEILREAYFWAPITQEVADRFVAAENAYWRGEFAAAAELYRVLSQQQGLAGCYAAAARLRLGQCLVEQHQAAPAGEQFVAVLEAAEAPEGLRSLAVEPLVRLAQQSGGGLSRRALEAILSLPGVAGREKMLAHLSLARALRQEGKTAEARHHEEAALAMEGLTARDKLNVRLQVAHGLAANKDYEGARAEYTAVAETQDAPPHYRSYARLCIARTYLHEGKLDAAEAEYRRVAAMAEAPESHRWEAEDCAREVAQRKAGKPARDPTTSRVQLPPKPEPAMTLYVAPDGSDANPGTKDKPFATPERARDAIRALRAERGLPRGGVEVRLAPGEYSVGRTFSLTADDSGTQDAPITYRSDPKGAARLTGGVSLRGFRPVRDEAVLARLPEEARGKVMAVDLLAQGITDFGELKPHGMSHGAPPTLELFFNGQAMPLARWPNKGFTRVGKVINAGGEGQRAVFEYETDRPERWKEAKDIWVLGYFVYLWADDSLPVAEIDTATRQVKLATLPGYGGVNQGAPCRYFNLLEEIDEPGEWYLDRSTGVLYFYPPSDPEQADIRLSMLSDPFVTMRDVSWVRFEGLVFEYGRGDGLVIEGGDHCLLAGCTVRCLGGNGVTISGGRGHGIFGCDIYCLGGGGTRVAGGDRKTLTPGEHFVENCHIYDFSRLKRTYAPAVLLEGVGNRVAHNVFHDSPGHGIRVEGNDHLLEFNEIYRVCMETDDQGGLDIWGNPTYRGNVFRYNFWHDIGDPDYVTPCGRAGIRLDDAISGVLIYGNVFLRCSQAQFGGVQIHGGKENVVENNIFVDCRYGISFSGWGEERWKQFLSSPGVVRQTREEVDITQPPYSTKYPALARLEENPDVNMVWRNVVYRCGEFLTRDRGIQDLMDNFVTSEDPGFADAENMNFELREGAAALTAIGFRPIPFSEIGLYEHPLRASPARQR